MPTEPWRYRCPECGSTTIRRCRNYGGASFNGTEPDGRWYCQPCKSHFDEPRDLKAESDVTQSRGELA